MITKTSVEDPNTLNLDPEDFGSIWIRIQGYTINFERKKILF